MGVEEGAVASVAPSDAAAAVGGARSVGGASPVDGGALRRPPPLLRFVALLAGLLLAPIFVGVGVSAATRPSGDYRETVGIDIHYSHYEPDVLTVPVGVPVRFVIHNSDPIDHEWIVGDAAVHAVHRTGTEMHHAARPTEVSIAAGQTVETIVTFPATGTLQYICHLPGHEAYGMIGMLTIR